MSSSGGYDDSKQEDSTSRGLPHTQLVRKMKNELALLHSRLRSFRNMFRSEIFRLRLTVFLLSVIVGILGGVSAVVFRHLVEFFTDIFMLIPQTLGRYWVIALPAIGGLMVGFLTYKFAPESKGHDGVAEVMEAVSIGTGDIRSRVPFTTTLASSITLSSGGSAGSEGPIVQISAGLASIVARLFKLDTEHKKLLVVCGAAAGLSAIFNAPIGGALFGLEVVYQGFEFPAVIPVLLSSVVATTVSTVILGDSPLFRPPPFIYHYHEILLCFLLGNIIGLLSILWIKGFYTIDDIFMRINLSGYLKPVLGGALVGLIIYFLPHVGGEGIWVIKNAFSGRIAVEMLLLIGILKIITCGITLGSGGSGGVFIPSMFIGAMFGGAFGLILNAIAPSLVSDSTLYAVVGMAAMLASACRAPLTGIIMVTEMTRNYIMLIPLTAACVTSYFISRLFMKESMYTISLFRKGIDVSLEVRKDILDYLKVGEIMRTDVSTVSPDMYVFQVLELIEKTGHTGYPVVTSDKKLFGIVTFRDVIRAVEEGKEEYRVRDIATRNLIVAYPDETVRQALDKMVEHDVGRLPVVDRGDPSKLLGIITRSDILKAHELTLLCRLRRQPCETLIKLLEKIEEERVHEL
mgnify:CR=1 FL=1